MTERFAIPTTITAIEERKERKYVDGIGEAAIFNEVSLGWYLFLQGSHEAIHVGMDKPDLKVGDKMKITIEKV